MASKRRIALRFALEDLIDRHGLTNVIEACAELSSAKADHVRTAWQDEPLAKCWEKATFILTRTIEHLKGLLP